MSAIVHLFLRIEVFSTKLYIVNENLVFHEREIY